MEGLPPDPTVYAVPFFIGALIAERWVLPRLAKNRDVLGYENRDMWASLAMGIGSLFTVTLINVTIFFVAGALYRFRLFELGRGWLGWTVAMLGWDFSFYWHHRAEHRIRILWACHENHHSSKYYNLSTALRQPWTPWFGIVLYPPWALLGVEPWLIMMSAGVNLIYQYWIHTEAIGKLPRWFEYVFNTPSHHRVHHGSNPEYIDKNYAGILILWDRIFGTFEEEKARVVYGLTKNVESYNPFVIAFHEYVAIARDVVAAKHFHERVFILIKGPEYHAPSLSPPPDVLHDTRTGMPTPNVAPKLTAQT